MAERYIDVNIPDSVVLKSESVNEKMVNQEYSDSQNSDIDRLELAREMIEETSENLFLTGKAGTGKTTFLRRLVERETKRMIVLAPTGVAAINAGGSTIHSFFQLDFGPYIPGRGFAQGGSSHKMAKHKLKIMRTLDLLVIDEISMVRPDVLDAVDATLRRYRNSRKPFGGVQLLLIGDLRQLAPVVQEQEWEILHNYYSSPYFFDSHALREAGFMMVELTKVFRQSDPKFIKILNAIRDNAADGNILYELNKRADKTLMPENGNDEGYIRLTTHNYRADAINNRRLAALPTQPVTFEAKIEGKFPASSYPAEERLTLKEGAQVMFIKNDPSGNQEYYNGLIGEVVQLSENEVVVRPRKESGMPSADIKVGCVDWENVSYAMTDEGEMKQTVEGSFTQVPLRLAWAITIHKSQGLTFERAIVDAANSFAPGQTYVALSRCRSLEGLVLDTPLPTSAIKIDSTVNEFIQTHRRADGGNVQIDTFKERYYGEMLMEMFNFSRLDDVFDSYYIACCAALAQLFPRFMEVADKAKRDMRTKIIDVSAKMHGFFNQVLPYRTDSKANSLLGEKVMSGSEYFASNLIAIDKIVETTPINIDNQTLRKRLSNAIVELRQILIEHISILNHFAENEFEPNAYLKAKAKAVVNTNVTAPKKSRKKKSVTVIGGTYDSQDKVDRSVGSQPEPQPSKESNQYIDNPEIYEKLTVWRKMVAGNRPAFTVLLNNTLMEISRRLPATSEELLSIKGMGKDKVMKYGEAILKIINSTFASES